MTDQTLPTFLHDLESLGIEIHTAGVAREGHAGLFGPPVAGALEQVV